MMLTRLRWFLLGAMTVVAVNVSLRNPALRERLVRALAAAGRGAVTAAGEQLRAG